MMIRVGTQAVGVWMEGVGSWPLSFSLINTPFLRSRRTIYPSPYPTIGPVTKRGRQITDMAKV